MYKLYIIILFVRNSFNFKMDRRRCSLELTDFRFCFRCELKERRSSNVNSSYWTSFDDGKISLLRVTGR